MGICADVGFGVPKRRHGHASQTLVCGRMHKCKQQKEGSTDERTSDATASARRQAGMISQDKPSTAISQPVPRAGVDKHLHKSIEIFAEA